MALQASTNPDLLSITQIIWYLFPYPSRIDACKSLHSGRLKDHVSHTPCSKTFPPMSDTRLCTGRSHPTPLNQVECNAVRVPFSERRRCLNAFASTFYVMAYIKSVLNTRREVLDMVNPKVSSFLKCAFSVQLHIVSFWVKSARYPTHRKE